MEEIWKKFHNIEVSNMGRVKTKYNKDGYYGIDDKDGYKYVFLRIKGKGRSYRIHRIVAHLFLGFDINDTKTFISHKNKIKSDNRVENIFIDYKNKSCENIDGEEWKEFHNIKVSNFGRIITERYPEGYYGTFSGRYFYTIVRYNGKKRVMGVHVIVLSAFVGEKNGYVPDHIDGDSQNNKLNNLRWATQRENSQNQKCHRDGKLVGCSYNKKQKKWNSVCTIDGTHYNLGSYDTELEAHNVYIKVLENYQNYNILPIKKVKGYYFDKFTNRWCVRIKGKFIGRYDSEEEAIQKIHELNHSPE